MRILFFLNNVSKTRHFDGVIETLANRGHTIVLAAARQRNRPLALPKRLLHVNHALIGKGGQGRIEVTACPTGRVDRWKTLAPAIRHARDYLRFFDERYSQADKLEQRSATHVPKQWLRLLKEHAWVRRRWRVLSRAMALAEAIIPSERLFDLFLTYEEADLVWVTPLVDYGSYQTDYVKSAHRTGVPVVFTPFSWDNLTNRGLIRVEPDRVLVWNDIQKSEATELHGISQDRVVLTGAPRFDDFFAMQPASAREEFCGLVGLDPAQPYLLYLCSSEFVAPREVEFVQRWMTSLRQAQNPLLRSCGVLVRPHPAHLKQWKNIDFERFPQVAVWKEKETMNADQGLYDSLHHAGAVVGLNTSAMIEAGILNKPVFTIVLDEFRGGQESTLHFHYLRASNGGLLHEASSFEGHVSQLSEALSGIGSGDQATRFVERFVRPRGFGVPVAGIMADEIESVARIRKRPQRPALWHLAARACVLGASRVFLGAAAPKASSRRR